MPIFLVKIIFVLLSNLCYFVSRLVFSTISYGLVLLIQAFKAPGQGAKGVVDQAGQAVKWAVESLAEVALEAISAVISAIFEFVKNGSFGWVSHMGSALGALLEQTRGSMDGALKNMPELLEVVKDLAFTIASDLWDNYSDALSYFKENALS